MKPSFASARMIFLLTLALIGAMIVAIYDFVRIPGVGHGIARADQRLCEDAVAPEPEESKDILFVGCGGFF